jgi:uncharacterized membrane protein
VSSRHYIISIIILVFIGIASLIGIDRYLWTDEGYTMLTTSHHLKDIAPIALRFELQPPIYFLLAKVWRLIFDSVFWLRLLSILITCCSIIYFEKLVRIITSKHVLTYTLLFALNPATIWVSLEIRSYGLMAFMAVLLLYFFYKYYLSDEKIKTKQRILYIILAFVGVWTNYYLVLLLVANFIVLLIIADKKKIIGYLVDMIVPALSTLLFIPFMSLQLESYTNNNDKVTGIKEILLFIYYRYEEFLFTPKHFGVYLRYILRFIFLFVIAFKIKSLIKTKDKYTRYLFFHLLAITVIFIVFIPFVNKNMIKFRHTIFILPLLLIAFFLIISQYKRQLATLAFIGIGILYLINAYKIYLDTMNENGIIAGALYIEKKEQNHENVVIYRNELDLVFRNYYRGNNRVEVMPFRITVDKTYNHDLWNIESKQDIVDFFEQKNLSEPIWILTDTVNQAIFGINYNYELLDNYIDEIYVTDFDTVFKDGIRLRKVSSQVFDTIPCDSLSVSIQQKF